MLTTKVEGIPMPLSRSCVLLLLVPIIATAFVVGAENDAAKPIALHPDNAHYLLFRGQPAFLLTSGEHYGAVLNKDFDFIRYLETLKSHGFNLTRTFSGVYREIPGSFGITENTLAPKPESYVCPWARSNMPGASDGHNMFDLMTFDSAYFERLKTFLTEAGKRAIVVELVLFCTIYNDKLWDVNPMKWANNVQGVGNVARDQVYTLKDKALTDIQEAFVRKIVGELKGFDNLYYEVCNEPYFGGVTREWNGRMIAVIQDAEKDLPAKHLIAQNIANGSQKIEKPNPGVSIFNFHYAAPPRTLGLNWDLKKPIADDETGFRGKEDLPYRTEAWNFFLAGGAIYSNLDYSYTASKPDGSAVITTSPGGGGPGLRRQLQILREFLGDFDFVKMSPNNAVIKSGEVKSAKLISGETPEVHVTARALVESGKACAVYVQGGSRIDLTLDIPAGSYRAEWINTKTGKIEKKEDFESAGRERVLESPGYSEDIALRVKRTAAK
jgi:hypothetical protein